MSKETKSGKGKVKSTKSSGKAKSKSGKGAKNSKSKGAASPKSAKNVKSKGAISGGGKSKGTVSKIKSTGALTKVKSKGAVSAVKSKGATSQNKSKGAKSKGALTKVKSKGTLSAVKSTGALKSKGGKSKLGTAGGSKKGSISKGILKVSKSGSKLVKSTKSGKSKLKSVGKSKIAKDLGGKEALESIPTVEVEPKEVTFKGPFTAATQCTHEIKNMSSEKAVTIKIKCSDNTLFRLKPVYGIIKPDGNLTLIIVCAAFQFDPERKYNHRFVIQYTECAAEEKRPAIELWKNATRFKEHRMAVIFKAS